MAKSLNKATIIGFLGSDPEMRYAQNGGAVCNFSVATDEGYKDKNGTRVEKTEWHRVSAFGKLAEIMGQYLKKGSKVYIEGKLQTQEWEKDGIKRYTTGIVANEMLMLDSNPQAIATAPQQPQQAQQAQPRQKPQRPQQNGYQAPPAPQGKPAAPQTNFDDDIPF